MAVAGEEIRKAKVPKEDNYCSYVLGDMVKSHVTVIERWGAIRSLFKRSNIIYDIIGFILRRTLGWPSFFEYSSGDERLAVDICSSHTKSVTVF